MAIQSFHEISSLKISKAIIDVATISKLFNNEALLELVNLSPNIKNIGATISRNTINIVKGISSFSVRYLLYILSFYKR